jgi:hypothetical protein
VNPAAANLDGHALAAPASSAMCVPEGIERSLVDIVAAMAFATALEGVT